MRALLINPASDFLTFKTHETLGLGYLASSLEANGHEVDIYDCNFEDSDPARLGAKAARAGYGFIGIGTMIGKAAHALAVVEEIRRRSDAVIAMGGYTATYEYEELLLPENHVDVIVRGEGEQVVPLLCDRIEAGDPWVDLPNLAFHDGGSVITTPMQALHMDLDDMPFPRRSAYLDRIGLASILSSRGCYAKCSFCNIQEFYNLAGFGGIRVRSAKNIVDEIQQIHESHGIRKFLFIDDDMLGAEFYKSGRNSELAEELIARGLDIDFEVAGRANDVIRFEQSLAAMRLAGLSRVYIGIESGSETQLKRQRKGVKKHHNLEALEVLRRNGIGLDMGLIPFDPWSTPQEVIENMRFFRDTGVMEAANLNSAAVTMILYPGTALYERALKEGLFERAMRFTYAYRFADEENAELFRDLIAWIKTRPVLGAVDRFIGNIKASPELRDETTKVLDPAARSLFSLWTDLFESWINGDDQGPVRRAIDEAEALMQNFCASGYSLGDLGAHAAVATPRAHADAGTLLRESHAKLSEALLAWAETGMIPVEVRDYVTDRYRADREAAEVVAWVHETGLDVPGRRRYVAGSAERVVLGCRGLLDTATFPAALAARPDQDTWTVLGLRVFLPPDLVDIVLREMATSQHEKTDGQIEIAVEANGERVSDFVRVPLGWSDVELTVAPDATPDRLVLRTTYELANDIEVREQWWRS